jgi:hypothetical protein
VVDGINVVVVVVVVVVAEVVIPMVRGFNVVGSLGLIMRGGNVTVVKDGNGGMLVLGLFGEGKQHSVVVGGTVVGGGVVGNGVVVDPDNVVVVLVDVDVLVDVLVDVDVDVLVVGEENVTSYSVPPAYPVCLPPELTNSIAPT